MDRTESLPAQTRPSLHAERVRVLREAGQRGGVDALADLLGDLARTIVERYRGDLRRLCATAGHDPARERALLTALPRGGRAGDRPVPARDAGAVAGGGPGRRYEWAFGDVNPPRALVAARRLGLGRSADDLAELAGSGESERLAWLVGALARVDLEQRYAEVAR